MSRARYLAKVEGKLENSLPLTEEEALEYIEYVRELESLCDEADMDDVHGTEGWRFHLGLEN